MERVRDTAVFHPSRLIQVLISSLCLLSSPSLQWCGERGSAGVTVGPSLKDLFQLKQTDSILKLIAC